MTEKPSIPTDFVKALADYVPAMKEAHRRDQHHDQRRAILIEFLRRGFRIAVEEIELERGLRGAQVKGYIDALYRSLVIEVKRSIEKERKQGLAEMEKYLDEIGEEGSFALLTDGLRFEVYLKTSSGLRRVNAFSAQDPTDILYRCLDAYLFTGKSVRPSAEEMILRFGEASPVFAASYAALERLYDKAKALSTVEVKYSEWEKLLSKVYGSTVGDPSLFLRHTYLAAFARLLVYLSLRRETPKAEDTPEILTGEAFHPLGISNLAEDDFFCWLLEAEIRNSSVAFLGGLAQHLATLDVMKIDEDLLRELYQQLVDPQTRHDLGEFYTPNWLADLVVRSARFKKGRRLLDPACGSGTFLFSAIRRLSARGLAGGKLVKEATSSVVGMDVHPLAVAIARVTYILALAASLRKARREVTIPVYMANSLVRVKAGEFIPVQVDAESEFLIPVSLASDPQRLDGVIEGLVRFAQREEKDETVLEGFGAWLQERGLEFQFPWPNNFRAMRAVIRANRDTVWAFILRNAFRPFLLAAKPFDLVVGNPPWLAYRYIRTKEYQADVKDLTINQYALLDGKERKLFTHMDTSVLFFALSADRYLRAGGTIAFVMPRSVLTGAMHYRRFREMDFGRVKIDLKEVLDLDKVSPLFNVPSCVLIGEKTETARFAPEVTKFSGRLPAKDSTLERAKKSLKTKRGGYKPPPVTARSQYYEHFLQGATIHPRAFWFVHVPGVEKGAVDRDRPFVETDPLIAAEAKPPWNDIVLRGNVEAGMLFASVLNKDLFPFGFVPRLVVLPVVPRKPDGGIDLIEKDAAVRRGSLGIASWLETAESIWAERKKSTSAMSIYGRLDFQSLLSRQRPTSGYKVIFNSSGSNLVAAVVDPGDLGEGPGGLVVNGFIADDKTYRFDTKDEREAHYLAAVLNAATVNKEIKAHQTRGAFGARDIHRRPLELPIPRFDKGNDLHMRLASLGARCARITEKVLRSGVSGRLVKIRSVVSAAIPTELEEIDSITRKLLSLKTVSLAKGQLHLPK